MTPPSALSLSLFVFFAFSALMSGCQQVTITDQFNLHRPALDFQGKGVRAIEGSLSGQLETGRGSSVNAASGSCSSCL